MPRKADGWLPPRAEDLTQMVNLAEDLAALRGLGAIAEADWQKTIAYVRYRLGFTHYEEFAAAVAPRTAEEGADAL